MINGVTITFSNGSDEFDTVAIDDEGVLRCSSDNDDGTDIAFYQDEIEFALALAKSVEAFNKDD